MSCSKKKKVRAFRSLRESPLAPYLYETSPRYRLGNMADPPSPTLSESGSAAGRPGEKRARKPTPTTVRKTHVREHSPVGTLIPSRICRSSRIFFLAAATDVRGEMKNGNSRKRTDSSNHLVSRRMFSLRGYPLQSGGEHGWLRRNRKSGKLGPPYPTPRGELSLGTGV